jgi:hypothetical protein
MRGTDAQRNAGLGLLLLGGYNALLGLISLAGGGDPAFFGATLAGGLVLCGLGWLVGRGSRPATLTAFGLLGLLALSQVAILAATGNADSVVQLVVAALLLWLCWLALRHS